MSLVHPIIEPQIALRACKGRFFGTTQEWTALLYSNRIVFTPVNKLQDKIEGSVGEKEEDVPEEVTIGIPQPPMTLGDRNLEILPNIGGAFFAVGRSRDMLALQYSSALVILSINSVTQTLELQGIWGLPKLKDPSSKHSHHRVSSAVSLVTLGETSSGHLSSSPAAGRSGLALSPQLPMPKASPDGTQIFVATRNKSQQPVLLILSSYGKELIRLDVEYLDIMTLGWISDEQVYFVYMNAKFHKKFQVCRLTNKAKTSGLFGMGRKSMKPGFLFETNVPIALDFQASTPDIVAGPDLVFKDCVMLGTRNGGYLRVNVRAAAWEPVLNAKNVVGAVDLGDSYLIIHTTSNSSAMAPTKASDFLFSVASDGTVHALRAQLEIGACLSSKHNIDCERRFTLKLLHLGGGVILDYKRRPFRLYRFQSAPTSKISLIDNLPVPPRITSKMAVDFLIKLEQGLYTRHPNGDDDLILKVMDRETQMDILLDRPGLFKVVRRDPRSLFAVFNPLQQFAPQVMIYDESQSKPNKLKRKATADLGEAFGGEYAKWSVFRIVALHRNITLVTLTSERIANFKIQYDTWADDFDCKWAIFMVNFNGSTTKHDPVQPRIDLILKSQAPELPARALPTPGDNNKYYMHVFNKREATFRDLCLEVNSRGEHELRPSQDDYCLTVMDEAEGVSFFTDSHGATEGLFMTGMYESGARIKNALIVDTATQLDGSSIVLEGADSLKTTIWRFDSGGLEFREYGARDVEPDKISVWTHHEATLRTQQRKLRNVSELHLHPEFKRKYFQEVSSNNDFRPLPEIPALICRGVGTGIDAEVFIKTPDNGLYAMFRIQNKRLHESLAKLERTILERRVGSWLTDNFRRPWLEQCQSSSMVAGSAYSTYWQLEEEEQEDLCAKACVDSSLIKKMRPP